MSTPSKKRLPFLLLASTTLVLVAFCSTPKNAQEVLLTGLHFATALMLHMSIEMIHSQVYANEAKHDWQQAVSKIAPVVIVVASMFAAGAVIETRFEDHNLLTACLNQGTEIFKLTAILFLAKLIVPLIESDLRY